MVLLLNFVSGSRLKLMYYILHCKYQIKPHSCLWFSAACAATIAAYAAAIADVNFFCFRPEVPLLGKFSLKNQNCLLKLNFGTHSNLNILNSILKYHTKYTDILNVHVFFFRPEVPTLGKFGLKSQNCLR